MGIDPVTLMIIQGVSTVISGFQQKRQADANADYYRQVAENQVKAREVASWQERRRNQTMRSQQLANIGASGIELTGAPLGYVKRTAEEQELDILMADYNAEVGASDTLMRASIQEEEGNQALLGSITSAASTGYNQYQDYKRFKKPKETWANGDNFR